MLARERRVAVHRVRTDANHLGAGLGEHLMAVAECAGLGGAAGSAVLREEVQDNHAVAKAVLQSYPRAALRREGEIGSLVADLDAARHVCRLSVDMPKFTISISPEFTSASPEPLAYL